MGQLQLYAEALDKVHSMPIVQLLEWRRTVTLSRKHFVSFKMRGKVQKVLVKQNGGTYDPSFFAFFTIKADAYTSLYVSPATRYVVQLSSASQVFFQGWG